MPAPSEETTQTPPVEVPETEPAAERAPAEASAAGTRLSEAASWLAALLGSVGGIGALGYLRGRYQHNSLFLPDEAPRGGVLDASADGADGVAAEDVWFESGPLGRGVRLHGWWMEHPKAAGTVLYCHGSSGTIAHRIGVYRQLREVRVNVLAFDYRGYGRSEGVPSERGLLTDVRAAYDHLVGPLGRSPEEILLFGHSLGGAVAIDAALDRQAAGLVVQSSFTDLKDMARARYPKLPLHLITRNGFRSIEKVARLTLPKLFIQATDDPTVPASVSRRLYEAAAPPKDLFEVESDGHNDVHLQGGRRYVRRLRKFRDFCLST